jgi:hypothetical protein
VVLKAARLGKLRSEKLIMERTETLRVEQIRQLLRASSDIWV